LKKFLCFGVMFVLAACSFTFAMLYSHEASLNSSTKVFFSNDHTWLLSGEKHLFDITDRTFNADSLFGFPEGIGKWNPVSSRTLYKPRFVSITNSPTLTDSDYVIGVVNGPTSTAYPLKILTVHQVVNDDTQDPPVLVYFGNCSRTAAAFSVAGDMPSVFSSSGYLSGNVDLLFDLDTESLFLPFSGAFVAGEKLGKRLPPLPCAVMPLGQWRTLHPDSRLMSDNTAKNIAYRRVDVLGAPFSLKMTVKGGAAAQYGETAPTLVIFAADEQIAVPFPAAAEGGKKEYKVSHAGRDYTVHFLDDWKAAYATDASGALVPSLRTVWEVYVGLAPDGVVADLR
jgi:hypothetical protein